MSRKTYAAYTMINHILSECSKLTQKEHKTRLDWVGNVIHWELCKKLIFDHGNKWCMHNPASVLVNDTHKLLWDFKILTDHQITGRRTTLVRVKKKKKKKKKWKKENLSSCGLYCQDWRQSKIERNRKER